MKSSKRATINELQNSIQKLWVTYFIINEFFLLDLYPNEAIFTNRAASYIQLKDFKKAMEDCQMALKQNPSFAKAYKRMFRCHLSLGNLDV